jgi:hypothetical protein
MPVSVSSPNMIPVLLALLFQQISIPPNFFDDGERIPLRSSDVYLNFREFGRADMIEIVPAGRQDDPSVRVTSAAIRNLTLMNREKSYVVIQERHRNDILTFGPSDLRQNSIVIVSVPQGVRLQISYNGINIPIRDMKEGVFLNDLTAQRGKPGAIVALLNERLKRNEIVLPFAPPAIPKARVIHAERPELTNEEIRVLDRLAGTPRAAISFEATVTDTGQVIDVRPISGIPQRTPREILEKLRDAAMHYSFEPYVVNGKSAGFTTTIVLELP